MLTAIHHQLTALSKDPKDPFTATVRAIAGPRHAPAIGTQLRRMILQMPVLIRQLRLWASEPDQPANVRRLHEFVLAYLYNPEDFLPEKKEGFFGYVDDAYLVARAFERTADVLALHSMSLEEEVRPLADQLTPWLEACRHLLPDVTSRIDRIVDNLMENPRLDADVNRREDHSAPRAATLLRRIQP